MDPEEMSFMACSRRLAVRALIGGCASIALALSVLPAPAQEADVDAEEQPRRTDLVETTERRLVQLDVTVEGKREAITDLAYEDFDLHVAGRAIDSFIVDNLCKLLDEEAGADVEAEQQVLVTPETPAAAAAPRARTSFLFYFDQHHLTMPGRQRALDLTRQLIPKLITNGNLGMIVSAGKQLESFAGLTDDQEVLQESIDRLEQDNTQWDPWVAAEESRVQEIVEILNDPADSATRALSTARLYQREEIWRTEKALHLFSMVLGRMTELNPPKAVVYFADTMRSNAGVHYLSFFSRRVEGSEASTQDLGTFGAAHAFERVVEEATAMGIRLFTIQAQGLVAPSAGFSVSSPGAAGGAHPLANSQRIKHAQDSLVGLALESGGRAFLNGVRATRIASQIQEDLSCVYLLNFDASHLRENGSYRVVVRSNRPGVKIKVRGRITMQSESRRLTSRLLAAFATPEGRNSDTSVSGFVIPTGFEKGHYSALVQLVVPASPLPTTSWDIGLSLISRGEVAADVSGHVSLAGPGIPVVLESEMRFRPGAFRLVGVAHETTGNSISTGEIETVWPDPNDAEVTLGPVVVMQPAEAAILRDDALRRSGAVAIGEDQHARTDRPTALIGIVCRAKFRKGLLQVERKLSGDSGSFAPFGPMELDLGDDRCVQIRDFIPAGSMSTGLFRYEVRVLDNDQELAAAVRTFSASSGEDELQAATPDGS
jgi:VWFA-related protein